MPKKLFKAGISGNPSGRPKGSKDKRAVYRDMLEERAVELINKASEMALEGNEPMLKLLLERILPAKPREEAALINLSTNHIRAQSDEIWRALSAGEISATTFVNLLRGVILHTEIIDKDMDYAFQTGLMKAVAASELQFNDSTG